MGNGFCLSHKGPSGTTDFLIVSHTEFKQKLKTHLFGLSYFHT